MSDELKPLTDVEVARDAYLVGVALGGGDRSIAEAGGRIVAELTRLRSDAWLRAAADDIGSCVTRDGWDARGIDSEGGVEGDIVAILRKHRDGKLKP